jgi:hypothetical protein
MYVFVFGSYMVIEADTSPAYGGSTPGSFLLLASTGTEVLEILVFLILF